jgi:hypothetical protein
MSSLTNSLSTPFNPISHIGDNQTDGTGLVQHEQNHHQRNHRNYYEDDDDEYEYDKQEPFELLKHDRKHQQNERSTGCCMFSLTSCCHPLNKKEMSTKTKRPTRNSCDTSGTSIEDTDVGTDEPNKPKYRDDEDIHMTSSTSSIFDENMFLDARDGHHDYDSVDEMYDDLRRTPSSSKYANSTNGRHKNRRLPIFGDRFASSDCTTPKATIPPSKNTKDTSKTMVDTSFLIDLLKGLCSVMLLNQLLSILPKWQKRPLILSQEEAERQHNPTSKNE